MSKSPIASTRTYTVAQLAEYLQVCTKTIRRFINRGILPAHKLGRDYRVTEADFQTFLAHARRRYALSANVLYNPDFFADRDNT
ncbi:MAG: helix-turn-helix domain-containing protein [Acidocella sp.]|uniref:helix-turn-helix domain-containing protein n=1 Tax=Acidocella sp. TaxID=50710 RepID=UPI003FBAABD7